MKTKVGNILVKKHSRAKDKLNLRFIEIAKELRDQKTVTDYVGKLLEEARQNRIESAKHQETINLLCNLEAFLDFK